jgi:AcrR family transcriptional regulator
MASRKKAPRRSYHHGDLRSALIETAITLVQKDGPASFSLREAARIVGVDAAACYRHFRDRQDILIAIAQLGFARLAIEFAEEQARNQTKPPKQRLKALAKVYLAFALRRPAEFRVMFGESGLHSRDQRLRLPEVEQSAYEQLETAVTEYLAAENIESGAPETALILWAGVHGVTRLLLDGAVPLTNEQAQTLLEALLSSLLVGLKKQPTLLRGAPKATPS